MASDTDCPDAGLDVTPDELTVAAEVFLTVGVWPVLRAHGEQVGDAAVGLLTARLRDS